MLQRLSALPSIPQPSDVPACGYTVLPFVHEGPAPGLPAAGPAHSPAGQCQGGPRRGAGLTPSFQALGPCVLCSEHLAAPAGWNAGQKAQARSSVPPVSEKAAAALSWVLGSQSLCSPAESVGHCRSQAQGAHGGPDVKDSSKSRR